jgi:hypothetical protein
LVHSRKPAAWQRILAGSKRRCAAQTSNRFAKAFAVGSVKKIPVERRPAVVSGNNGTNTPLAESDYRPAACLSFHRHNAKIFLAWKDQGATTRVKSSKNAVVDPAEKLDSGPARRSSSPAGSQRRRFSMAGPIH